MRSRAGRTHRGRGCSPDVPLRWPRSTYSAAQALLDLAQAQRVGREKFRPRIFLGCAAIADRPDVVVRRARPRVAGRRAVAAAVDLSIERPCRLHRRTAVLVPVERQRVHRMRPKNAPLCVYLMVAIELCGLVDAVLWHFDPLGPFAWEGS